MTNPTLSYVGSVDTSNAGSGNVIFSISFPFTIQALIFEYKYQPVDTPIVNPETLQYSGFVYPDAVETAQFAVSGVSSYLLPLPSPPGDVDYSVAVRVYHIDNDNQTSYTSWSNSLVVYRPPSAPEILTALYDRGDYSVQHTRLWINLDPNSVDVNNHDLKYIASYYYVKEGETSTTWETTGLLDLNDDSHGPYLSFLAKGNVSHEASKRELYVAVNTVLPFKDPSEVTYYSISEISNTSTATQAEIVPSTITDVSYVPNVNGTQQMVVKWDPPRSAFIPDFMVDRYILEVKIEGDPAVDWVVVDSNIPTTLVNGLKSYEYNIDTNNNYGGRTFQFRVDTVLQSGTVVSDESGYSNVLGATQYNLSKPTITNIVYLMYNDDPVSRQQKMKVLWSPVGYVESSVLIEPVQYEVFVSINNGDIISVGYVDNVSEFTYDIQSHYLSDINNIAFDIIARCSDASDWNSQSPNMERLNTFTYAAQPESLYIDWAVPDKQNDNNVDVVFTFTNTLNTGLGGLQSLLKQYVGQIVDASGNVANSQTVEYDVNRDVYTMQMSFPADPSKLYVVKVFLQTPDTNYNNELRDGLPRQSSTIIASDVPFFYDVVAVPASSDPYEEASFVSFKIVSNVLLAPRAVLVYNRVAGTPEVPIEYLTNSVTPERVLENYIYTFTGNNAITIPNSYLAFILAASNQAGIGYHIDV
jgi:hypothetical protein